MKQPRIVITGASGLIGWQLYNRLKKDYPVVGSYNTSAKPGLVPLQLLDQRAVDRFVQKTKPEVLLHLVALTDVDRCEREPALAQAVHVDGTEHLVQAVRKTDCRFIYFSTDFVFDGTKGNYSETDKTNPINVYGSTKLEAEKLVQSLKQHVIVRTTTPYSDQSESKKFVGSLIEKLHRSETVFAFDDLIRSPTLVENLVECTAKLLSKEYNGILNIAGSTSLSMFDAAMEVARIFSFDQSLVKKSSSSTAKLDAKRPLNTGLNVSKAVALGLPIQSFEEGLLELKESPQSNYHRKKTRSYSHQKK